MTKEEFAAMSIAELTKRISEFASFARDARLHGQFNKEIKTDLFEFERCASKTELSLSIFL